MTTPEIPEAIVALFSANAAARDLAVAEKLDSLTERERKLVTEAAAMGWVQGMRHADLKYPGDHVAVRIVLDAAISPAFKNLYPEINRKRRKRS